ncbi:ATP binding protein [Penicillium cosmopolitanum]|uniref:ATP binding protein n=1 Tax=Penicillium cosmopolitanum TaxID=1131564 RepID=A0A9W9SHQ2_9EURO|nr:ATP binding protein [Penicillium cosmopolitanum]KAJ5378802.1 ATP binding protein [Penicillium cosmopolitanum]
MAPRGRGRGKFVHPDGHPNATSSQSKSPGFPANPAIRNYFAPPNLPDGVPLPRGQTEDWRKKSELPTTEEILGLNDGSSDILLLPNHIFGPWPSTELYLNAHYNLIREDAVANLRDAVLYVRTYPRMGDNGNIAIYEKVFIVQVTLTTSGIAFRVQFSTRRAGKRIHWKYSSRLITGNIVALSPVKDSFFNKVHCGCCCGETEDIKFDPQQEWIMVQARSGYYEAHRHTMKALQKLSQEQFPLKQHICALKTDIGAPQYVLDKPVINFQALSPPTTDGNTSFNILKDFPATPMAGLNPHQAPPGTGKTFVSIIFLKLLLSQMTPNDPPIIIATHTNHALDQILSIIAQFEDNFIRLGSRSIDPDIRKRMLYEMKKSLPMPTITGGLFSPARNDLQRLSAQVAELLTPFDQEGIHGPIKASTFADYGLLTQSQCDSLMDLERWGSSAPAGNDTNHIAAWLDDQVKELNLNHWIEEIVFTEDDIDIEYEQLKELEAEQGPNEDEYETLNGRSLQFRTTHRGVEDSSYSKQEIRHYLSMSDLMKIPVKARGPVYNLLRDELLDLVNAKLRTVAKSYNFYSDRLKVGRWERDFEILRKAKLVAMTTTGLSKYRGLVSSLKPRTVLIEEAAEVLEAPTTVSCFESIQQLILVGDHMQLKAKCTLMDLAGEPFFLETSMFERLVRNDIAYVQLREQRRMVPDIRELLMPIYGSLYDHPSVLKTTPIPGMGDLRSFFFTHEWPESGDSLTSKLNEWEAIMVVEFYVYLVLNGISIFDMTVLTFYNGQRKLILKHMRTNKYLVNHTPKVVTVDSYQGEENEIILLSLVRSNKSNGIGFLAADNRVCVAISRAKRGLYMFGNSETLEQFSPLWNSIISILRSPNGDPRISGILPLTCKKHKNETLIRVPGDWKTIKGGCREACGEELGCGHKCTLLCHGFDHSLEWTTCQQSCTHVQKCCELPCTEICGKSHHHSCDCMNDKFSTMSIMENPRVDHRAGKPGPNGASEAAQRARRQVIAMEGVSSWGQFVNNARAGNIDRANMGVFQSVGSQDVQEGLKRATETYISLASRRPNQEPASNAASKGLVNPSKSEDSPINKPAALPPADLIEFEPPTDLIDLD